MSCFSSQKIRTIGLRTIAEHRISTKRLSHFPGQVIPQLFDTIGCEVQVLKPERTFWEKVTLLHATYHNSKKPDRLSRHYYDVSRLYRSLGAAVVADTDLLSQVVRHKQTFFHEAAANYEMAKLGTLRVLPGKEEAALRRDWLEMQEMLFGEAPTFDEVLTDFQVLEDQINGQRSVSV